MNKQEFNMKCIIKISEIVRLLWKKTRYFYSCIAQTRAIRPLMEIKKQELRDGTYYELSKLINKTSYLHYLVESQRIAVQRIRNNHDAPIRIAFQTALLQTWVGDELIKMFSLNSRFDVTVLLTWQTNTKKEEIASLQKHFENINIKTTFADGTICPRDFDIIVFTSPYIEALDCFSFKEIKLRTLVCYIPYGFLIADLQEMQFNQFLHNIVWRNYSTTKRHIELAQKYCNIGSHGMVYSGYPKMDIIYSDNNVGYKWKIQGNVNTVKKIIYAPHHSINAIPYYSTFAINKDFFLDYAKKHADSTSWVFKPHPLLKKSAVNSGVFRTESEYDAYVKEWNNLPNACVEDGEYLHIMATSNAMILDSVSFMCEYMYFNKPILFLTRSNGGVNEFGEMVKDVLYKAQGNDYARIEEFVERTINIDKMKYERNEFFNNELNYLKDNGMTATEFIYKDIVERVSGEHVHEKGI